MITEFIIVSIVLGVCTGIVLGVCICLLFQETNEEDDWVYDYYV